MNFVEIKEEEYAKFFNWILEKEDITLEKEIDLLLASSYDEPYIYYTKEIEEFFATEPMQRIKQINQLGTSMVFNANAYHTRLEHCKGAYKNALDFWVIKCKDSEYRNKIDSSKDKDRRKNLILADIMEMARHDDCHTMLSHALEGLICNGKADHEEIGKRILLEYDDYKRALNNIRPGLYEVMCNNAINDKSAFKLLREGNTDFDRMDYIMRDSLYLGAPYYCRELVENMIRNCNIKEIEINGVTQEVPVYTLEGFKYVQEFLKIREIGYETEYSSQDRKVLDHAEQCLCRIMASNENIESDFIRPSIKNYMQEDIIDIDILGFLETNDIRYFTEVLDIAMHNENEDIRELATLCLPSTVGLLQFGVEMLDTKQKGKDLEKYKDYELEYIRKLNELRNPDNNLKTEIESENKRKLFSAVSFNNESEWKSLQNGIEQIIGKEKKPNSGVVRWKKTIRVYKKEEPIYAEDEDGKIYTLDNHPKLEIDISDKNVMGIGIIPSAMRLAGYEESIIEKVKAMVDRNNKKEDNPIQKHNSRGMSKYQVGKEPYLIGFEEK